MTIRTWTNDDIIAWHIRGEARSVLLYTSASVEFTGPAEGAMTLIGVLPLERQLLHLEHGDRIELLHVECGRREVYENGDLAFVLIIDGIEGPAVRDMSPRRNNLQDELVVEVTVSGPLGVGPELKGE